MWKPGMQGSSHFLSSKYVYSQVKQYPQVSELIKILRWLKFDYIAFEWRGENVVLLVYSIF